MNNELLCSTGTMVGCSNLWNYNIFLDYGKYIIADGFELMMVKAYYDKLDEIASKIERSGLRFRTIHTEKDIGVYLSCSAEGDREEAFRLFELNCLMGKNIGAEKAILHLWSGTVSDTKIENNIGCLARLYEIADKIGIKLLVENVPCAANNPYDNFLRILEAHPNTQFVYDIRFGAFHEQNEKFLSSKWLWDGTINHLHLSDYVGPAHSFSSLRPILHMGKGIINTDNLLPKIFEKYHGTVTLESPEILPNTCAVDIINTDLDYIRGFITI